MVIIVIVCTPSLHEKAVDFNPWWGPFCGESRLPPAPSSLGTLGQVNVRVNGSLSVLTLRLTADNLGLSSLNSLGLGGRNE